MYIILQKNENKQTNTQISAECPFGMAAKWWDTLLKVLCFQPNLLIIPLNAHVLQRSMAISLFTIKYFQVRLVFKQHWSVQTKKMHIPAFSVTGTSLTDMRLMKSSNIYSPEDVTAQQKVRGTSLCVSGGLETNPEGIGADFNLTKVCFVLYVLCLYSQVCHYAWKKCL